MNESITLLSSMSPKIKDKLKPGEKQFRRGASILALKRNIRRSSMYSISRTKNNEDLKLVESTSTTSTESVQSVKVEKAMQGSIIIISDTESSRNSLSDSESSTNSTSVDDEFNKLDRNEYKTSENYNCHIQTNCLLPEDKFAAISCWVANINTKNNSIDSSVYTDLSTICGTEIGSSFLPKETGHAVNSTFASGDHKKFDELFIPKNKYKDAEDSAITKNDKEIGSFTDLIIEDSFKVSNSTKTSLDHNENKDESEYKNHDVIDILKNTEGGNSCDMLKEYLSPSLKQAENGTESFTTPQRNVTDQNDETFKINSKWKEVEISDDNSGPNEADAETILDTLYGKSWRENKKLILSTEPRKNANKPKIKDKSATESKPKYSLIYKNPYLDSERTKSRNRLEMHHSKTKDTLKSPWLDRLKALCDSDTNSESSTERKLQPVNINFDESSDEDDAINEGTKSKYFKKKSTISSEDKENRNLSSFNRIRNKTKESSGSNSSSSSRTSTSGSKNFKNHINSESDSKFRYNVTQRSRKRTETDFYPKINNKSDTSDTRSSNKNSTNETSSSCSTSSININPRNINTNKKVTNYKNSKPSTTSISLNTPSCDENVKTKTKSKLKTDNFSSRISTTSDEEWEEELSRIERKTIATNGRYSFLASLSDTIPLSQADPSARIFRSSYKTNKEFLLKKLYKLYNEEVFDNVLPKDMLIEWSDKMRTTAGFCYCKKIIRSTKQIERSARLALSTKVLDTPDRLRDTLIHELCHAATFIVNCVSDGHGQFWQSWACKALKRFPELPPIKRCHNYVVNTKYTYRCTGCGYSIGRHSKSLDIERKRCGHCYGKFDVFINKTNKNGETKAVAATPKKEATGFALFVKENYAIYKSSDRNHGQVMKLLGQKFQTMKLDKK